MAPAHIADMGLLFLLVLLRYEILPAYFGACQCPWLVSSLSMGVPSNGGIGPWQWAVIFGLALYSSDIPGLTHEYALAFANLVMGVQTLVLILQGLFTFGCIALTRRADKS